MPLYDYVCGECGHEHIDVRNSIENRNNGPLCPYCAEEMVLKLASPSFKIDSSFAERLNKGYKEHQDRVKQGLAKPNSIDRHRGSIG